MVIILGGMITALVDRPLACLPQASPSAMPFTWPGALGRLNAIDFSFDLNNRYNLWSGLIGGFFLAALLLRHRPVPGGALPFRPVGAPRAASGCSSTACSRCRCSSCILFIGAMVFVFYQFDAAAALLQSGGGETGQAGPDAPPSGLPSARIRATARSKQRPSEAACPRRRATRGDTAAGDAAAARCGRRPGRGECGARERPRRSSRQADPGAQTATT